MAIEAKEETVEVQVGERLQDWCKRLEEHHLLTCDAVLSIAKNADFSMYSFVAAGPMPMPAEGGASHQIFLGNRFEGIFTPATYRLKLTRLDAVAVAAVADTALANARRIVDLLLQRSQARFDSMQKGLGLEPWQQRILASMVEKEAVANTAYDTVATVFYNRLQRNDKLGSCPTVEYALGFHRPFLLFKDLAAVANSPYNVYKKKGLPPTPICFFSDAALAAVTTPAVADSVYFFVYDWTTRRLHFEKLSDYDKHQQNAARVKANYQQQFGDIRQYFPDKFYQY